MPEEFVKKEVFDARMDRMEAIMEKNLNEIKTGIREIRSEIHRLDGRIQSVQTLYWSFAIGFILVFLLLTTVMREFVKSLRKPPVTMEDVERAIAAAMGQSPQPGPRS